LRDILAELGLDLDKEVLEALVIAARWHDRGKAHCVFREALPQDAEHRGDDWAKAPDIARYTRKGFRHELASALAMLQAKMPDLACYLAAAHHGKIRLSIRSLPLETRPKDGGIRFARGVWDGDELPETDLGGGFIAPHTTLSLEPMELGLDPVGNYSWSERMLRLRDKAEYGPFRLAFLETLLRVADMRASKTESSRLELEGRENARD
jgi:CRISPR-associated endonuclease/helicase Cas3